MPRPDARRAAGSDYVVQLLHDGRSGTTFRGWPDDDGQPQGIPLPVDELRGRAVFAHRDGLPRRERLALPRLEGTLPGGTLACSGLLISPLGGGPAEIDLSIRVPSIAISEELGESLTGLEDTAFIWPAFEPEGGALAAGWRLVQHARHDGMTAAGDVAFEGTRLRWEELPVPFREARGSLRLRWSDRGTPVVRSSGAEDVHRPFGVAFEVAGSMDTAEGAAVRGALRSPQPPGDGSVPLEESQLSREGPEVLSLIHI